MGRRSSYAAGAFSWVELATPDPAGASAFYGALLGWEVDGTTFRLAGDAVAGLSPTAYGTAVWTNYVTVTDAAATAAHATRLGGRELGDVAEVDDAGRMAVLVDPQGAEFAVWQPAARAGAELVNDVGCLCMNELVTMDTDGAREFYEGLFGWTTAVVDTGPGGPLIIGVHNRETLNASFSVAPPGVPAQWKPYFTVVSLEDALTRVDELRGTAVFGPVSTGDGAIAVALDAQGAPFGLFEGVTDP
jgi:uncharacterized protein